MECVCGCGRKLPKEFADRNYMAAGIALELLIWDKDRALPGPGPAGREGLIARGVECYERLLYSLHGEGAGDPDPECDEWLRESRSMRSHRSDMTKRRFLGGNAPNLSKEDMDRLDRRHPERSFTGGLDAAQSATTPPGSPPPNGSVGAPAPAAPADDDLVTKLERLRVLHEDGLLTDEEFAAAKTRLLERD